MLSNSAPILAADHKAYIDRAHQMRADILATFVRDMVRVVRRAAR